MRGAIDRKAREPVRDSQPRRLRHDDRKNLIREGATRYFAEFGYDLSTPELARRIGIAQSLLYRYYASKQHLIEDVHRSISLRPEDYDRFIAALQDRHFPLRDRLRDFYVAFANAHWGYERTRLIMWANLLQPELNEPYMRLLYDRIHPCIAGELIAEAGISEPGAKLRDLALELVTVMHGTMFHTAGMRRWILDPPRFDGDIAAAIGLQIDLVLPGAKEVLASR